jgi:hypothetical protein
MTEESEHYVVLGHADMCMIKGDDFISLSRDVLVASASIMLEPHHRVTWLQYPPSISGQFVVFWVARKSPTTVDP